MNGPAYGAAGMNYADGTDFKGARLTTDHTDHTDRHEHSDSSPANVRFGWAAETNRLAVCAPQNI